MREKVSYSRNYYEFQTEKINENTDCSLNLNAKIFKSDRLQQQLPYDLK